MSRAIRVGRSRVFLDQRAISDCRVTDRVDSFSFGVLLWEIVTGEWPVRGSLRMPLVPQARL